MASSPPELNCIIGSVVHVIRCYSSDRILRVTRDSGEAKPIKHEKFDMNYKMPSAKATGRREWDSSDNTRRDRESRITLWATCSQLLDLGSATSSNGAEEGDSSLLSTAGTSALQHELLVSALRRELVLPVLLEVVAERDARRRAAAVREKEGVHWRRWI